MDKAEILKLKDSLTEHTEKQRHSQEPKVAALSKSAALSVLLVILCAFVRKESENFLIPVKNKHWSGNSSRQDRKGRKDAKGTTAFLSLRSPGRDGIFIYT